MICVGDKIHFRKFTWEITRVKGNRYLGIDYWYRVWRRYLRIGEQYFVPLSNTDQDYLVRKDRWEFLKRRVREDPDFLPQMSLWSNYERQKIHKSWR